MEPVPLKRVFFWIAYVLGTLVMPFGLLLGMVPRGIRDNNLDEIVVWGICSAFLLLALFLDRMILDRRRWKLEGQPGNRYHVAKFALVRQLIVSCFFLIWMLTHLFYVP